MTNFICSVRERHRSVCAGLPCYGAYEGRRYCVLHFPGEDKTDRFLEAVEGKLARKDYEFGGAVFPVGASNFEHWLFGANASFAGAVFCGEADFHKATFRKAADFSRATFVRNAIFYKARFEGQADFSRTIFEREANFRRTTFKGLVEFRSPTNEDDCTTYTFNARANFSKARFEERVTFLGRCAFDTEQRGATLRDALIEKPESFSLDRVRLRPSWFIDTNVRRLRFTNVEWRGLPDGPQGSIEDEVEAIKKRRRDEDEQAGYARDVLAKTCRELSANAEENREYLLANEFHYWSMEALRTKGWSRSGAITTLYWALSGYGVRAARAFWVLVAIWAAFAALYVLAAPSEFGKA